MTPQDWVKIVGLGTRVSLSDRDSGFYTEPCKTTDQQQEQKDEGVEMKLRLWMSPLGGYAVVCPSPSC
jgi:hypothetical protein